MADRVIDILFRAQNIESVQRSTRELAEEFRGLDDASREAAASFGTIRDAAANVGQAVDGIQNLENIDIGIRIDRTVLDDVRQLRANLSEIEQQARTAGVAVSEIGGTQTVRPEQVVRQPQSLGLPDASSLAADAERAAASIENIGQASENADTIIAGLKQQFTDLYSLIEQRKAEIRVGVTGDAEARDALRNLNELLKENQRSAEETQTRLSGIGRIGNIGTQLKENLGPIAAIGAGVGGALIALRGLESALSGVVGAFRSVVDAASEQEQANARFAASQASIGNLSAIAARDMRQFADAVQATTQFTDEQAQATAALISQIGKLRGEELQETTRLALDMAAALGRGSEEIGILFGRLAAGQSGGFERLGIQVDETLPKVERFNQVMAEVEQAFGGTAQTLANTYAGSVTQLKNSFGELGESLGNLVLPQLTAFAQGATQAVNTITDNLSTLRGETQLTVSELVALFEQQQSAIRGAAPEIRRELETALTAIQQRATIQLRTEVQRGNLDEVLRTAEEINRRMQGVVADGLRSAQQAAGASAASNAIRLSIQMAVERGDIDAARAELADLETLVTEFPALDVDLEKAKASIEAFRRPAQDLLQGLRDEFLRGIELRVNADLEKANSDIDGLIRRVQGDDVELFIRGTPQLQDALDALDRVRTEAEELRRGFDVPIRVRQVDELTEEERRRLQEDVSTGRATIQVGPPDISQVADAARQAQLDLDRVAELKKTARIEIEGATSISDITATLKTLEEAFIAAQQKADLDIGQRRVAETLRDAVREAQRLAGIRVDFLVERSAVDALQKVRESIEASVGDLPELRIIPADEASRTATMADEIDRLSGAMKTLADNGTVEARVSGFNSIIAALAKIEEASPRLRTRVQELRSEIEGEFRIDLELDIETERTRRQIETLVDLIRSIRETTGGTTLTIAGLDRLPTQIDGVARSSEELRAALDAVAASQDPAELLAVYDLLGAALRRAEDGTASFSASTREEMARARDDILSLLPALAPLEDARRVTIEVQTAVTLGNFELAEQRIELLRQRVQQFPGNVGIRVELENAEQAYEDARAVLDRFYEAHLETVQRIEEIGTTGIADAFGETLSILVLETENQAEQVVDIFKQMVRDVINELGKLAAFAIFRALFGTLTGGAGSVLPGLAPGPGGRIRQKGDDEPAPLPQTIRQPTPQSIEIPAPEISVGPVSVQELPGQVLPAPDVVVEPAAPVPIRLQFDLPGDVRVSPAVTVDALDPVALDAPRATVADLAAVEAIVPPIAPVRLDAPDLDIAPIERQRLAPPEIEIARTQRRIAAPDVDVAPLDRVRLAAELAAPPTLDAVRLAPPAVAVAGVDPVDVTPAFRAGRPAVLDVPPPDVSAGALAAIRFDAPEVRAERPQTAIAVRLDQPSVSVEDLAAQRLPAPDVAIDTPATVRARAAVEPPAPVDLGRMAARVRPPAPVDVQATARVRAPGREILPPPDLQVGRLADVAARAPALRVAAFERQAIPAPEVAIGLADPVRLPAPEVRPEPIALRAPAVTVEPPELVIPPPDVAQVDVRVPVAVTTADVPRPQRVRVAIPAPDVILPRIAQPPALRLVRPVPAPEVVRPRAIAEPPPVVARRRIEPAPPTPAPRAVAPPPIPRLRIEPAPEISVRQRGAVPSIPAGPTPAEVPRLATQIDQLGRRLGRIPSLPVPPRPAEVAPLGTAVLARTLEEQRVLAAALRAPAPPSQAIAVPGAASLIERFRPTSRPLGPQITFAPQAMDARSFEDWIRDGAGRKALSNLFSSGRGF